MQAGLAHFNDDPLPCLAMQAENCEKGYFVTLSITGPDTTYTTIIQLGSPTNCTTATPTGQQAIVTPTQTPASDTNQTPVSNNNSDTSATTIGIVVGCITLGVLLLLAICCISRQHDKNPPDRQDRKDDRGHQVFTGSQVHREPKVILDHQGQLGFQGQRGFQGQPGFQEHVVTLEDEEDEGDEGDEGDEEDEDPKDPKDQAVAIAHEAPKTRASRRRPWRITAMPYSYTTD